MVATVRVALVDARHSDIRPRQRGIAEYRAAYLADSSSRLQQPTSAVNFRS